MITLAEAIRTGWIEDFIRQEDARGVGPVDRRELEAKIAQLIKQPQSAGRTSGSRDGGGSTGT